MKSHKTINKSTKSVSNFKTAKIVRPVVKASGVVRSINNISIDEMITLITNAIQFKFKTDKTAPGLTIAKLKNEEIYVSVVRYNAPFGKEKKVEYKSRSKDMMSALCDIARQITGEVNVNPVDQLSRFLRVNVPTTIKIAPNSL